MFPAKIQKISYICKALLVFQNQCFPNQLKSTLQCSKHQIPSFQSTIPSTISIRAPSKGRKRPKIGHFGAFGSLYKCPPEQFLMGGLPETDVNDVCHIVELIYVHLDHRGSFQRLKKAKKQPFLAVFGRFGHPKKLLTSETLLRYCHTQDSVTCAKN